MARDYFTYLAQHSTAAQLAMATPWARDKWAKELAAENQRRENRKAGIEAWKKTLPPTEYR